MVTDISKHSFPWAEMVQLSNGTTRWYHHPFLRTGGIFGFSTQQIDWLSSSVSKDWCHWNQLSFHPLKCLWSISPTHSHSKWSISQGLQRNGPQNLLPKRATLDGCSQVTHCQCMRVCLWETKPRSRRRRSRQQKPWNIWITECGRLGIAMSGIVQEWVCFNGA